MTRSTALRVLTLHEVGPPTAYFTAAFEELIRRGVDLVTVTIDLDTGLLDTTRRLGGRGIDLAAGGIVRLPSAVGRFRSVIRDVEPDLIHASEPVAAGLAGLASTASRGSPPLVYHRHHLKPESSHPVFHLLERIARRRAASILAVSEAVADVALGEGARRVCTAQNGLPDLRPVDEAEVAQLRQDLELPHGTRVVTFVARIRPLKGYEILVKAMQLAAEESPAPLALIIVGDGPGLSDLRRLSSQVQVTTRIVGYQEDVSSWLALADAVAIPSLVESFGLVAIEAMAAARPVAASRVGGLAETVIHERTGLLTQPGDPVGLSESILRILTEPELAAEMGREGRVRYERHYTTGAMINRWLACYEQVMAEDANPGAEV